MDQEIKNHMGSLSSTSPKQQREGPVVVKIDTPETMCSFVGGGLTTRLRGPTARLQIRIQRSQRSDVFRRRPFLVSTPTSPSPAGDMSREQELFRTRQAASPVTGDGGRLCGMQRDSREQHRHTQFGIKGIGDI